METVSSIAINYIEINKNKLDFSIIIFNIFGVKSYKLNNKMKNILVACFILFTSNAMSQVIVNSDGSHTIVSGDVIINPDGSHSIKSGNVIINSNGTHSIISGNTIINSDGSHTVRAGNIAVSSDGSHSILTDNNILTFLFGKKDKLEDSNSENKNRSINNDSFSFILESTEGGVRLSETLGCAFKELSFDLKNNELKSFDQYGMRYTHDKKIYRSIETTPFIIHIKRTKNGFILKGISGTNFRKLNFHCSVGESVAINNDGITLLSD